MNAAGDFERLPLLGGYVVLFLWFSGDSLRAGLRISGFGSGGRLCGIRQLFLSCLLGFRGLLWERFLTEILDDLESGFAINLGKVQSISSSIGTISPILTFSMCFFRLRTPLSRQ